MDKDFGAVVLMNAISKKADRLFKMAQLSDEAKTLSKISEPVIADGAEANILSKLIAKSGGDYKPPIEHAIENRSMFNSVELNPVKTKMIDAAAPVPTGKNILLQFFHGELAPKKTGTERLY